MQDDPNEDSPEYRAAYAKTLRGQMDALSVALHELWDAIKRPFRSRELLPGMVRVHVGHIEGADDGFRYWPACPTCGGPVGCYGRYPMNAVPAEIYTLRCNDNGHASAFTHAEIMAMQDVRRVEVSG